MHTELLPISGFHNGLLSAWLRFEPGASRVLITTHSNTATQLTSATPILSVIVSTLYTLYCDRDHLLVTAIYGNTVGWGRGSLFISMKFFSRNRVSLIEYKLS